MKKLLLLCLFVTTFASAQTLEIVVPVPPGGPVDAAARTLQEELHNRGNLESVVIYKPGADGQIAANYFLANQSNKLLMVSTATSIALKVSNKTVKYDPINDFRIVGPITTANVVLSVRKDSGMNTTTDLINMSKSKTMNCGTAGSFVTLYMNHFVKTNNLNNVVIVPYKSTPQPTMDLLSGTLDCFGTVRASVMDNTDLKVLKVDHKKSMVFKSFTAVAFGTNLNEDAIKKVLIDMNADKEFIASMHKKGYDVPSSIDFNYGKALEGEYLFLDRYNATHNIIEVIR
jgi:tripartite-type tricarboxylate transporter receptor subunit TctC